MSGYSKADEFLKRYSDDYRRLNRLALDACEGVRERLGFDKIIEVYGRPDNAAAGGPFKSPEKIASKVRKWGKSPTTAHFLEINDIVGITMVIAYPDYVEEAVQATKRALRSRKAKFKDEVKHEAFNGYYATHLNYTFTINGEALHFEVQFKTLLHNAWSRKMHDLTYKPARAFDPRLSALMGSVADTIESLENQSRLIREMITANWNVEEETRRAARQQVFEGMLKYSEEVWAGAPRPPKVLALRDMIEEAKPWLASEPADSKRLQQLIKNLDQCCQGGPDARRFAWILVGVVASQRPNGDLTRLFRKHADDWLAEAGALFKAGQIKSVEVRAVPLVFYVIGDLDGAIEYCQQIEGDAAYAKMDPPDRLSLEFNRITFMIEREYHTPTQLKSERTAIEAEITAFFAKPALGDHPGKTFASDLMDTEGLAMITFATTSREARDGIEKCLRAAQISEDDAAITDAYADLHMRLGWRRYFELELLETMKR